MTLRWISKKVPVAVKALLSIRHGTSILATGGELFGGAQFAFDLHRWWAMKHHCERKEQKEMFLMKQSVQSNTSTEVK